MSRIKSVMSYQLELFDDDLDFTKKPCPDEGLCFSAPNLGELYRAEDQWLIEKMQSNAIRRTIRKMKEAALRFQKRCPESNSCPRNFGDLL